MVAPSPILQELNALGVLRANYDPLTRKMVGIIDPSGGASAYFAMPSVQNLIGLVGASGGQSVQVASFYPSGTGNASHRGGGLFIWDATIVRSLHDGIVVVSPTAVWDGSIAGANGFLLGTGATQTSTLGCWVRQFTKLSPYMAGAVGTGGSQDDLFAFTGLTRACNKLSSVFVGVEPGNFYVSDAFAFDVDNLEIYLHAGSLIYTTAATSQGQTLGCIGYFGAGVTTTPVRSKVKISGPGKVIGWAGGSNENAIGIVRYANVEVDGVVVSGGNKGITAQYGIAKTSIRNVEIPSAGYRAISIEDQGSPTTGDVLIENIKIGTTGDAAILAAGANIVVNNIYCASAHATSGATTTGAIHFNSTGALVRSQANNIKVDECSTAKGVVHSGSSNAQSSNVYIGHSAGNAVEFYNCTKAAYGFIDAPASQNGAMATGTTPPLNVIGEDTLAFTNGESTMPRLMIASTGLGLGSGTMRMGYIRAKKTETITKIRIPCGGTAAGATPTLVRVGIYEAATDGSLTLVASTANDTTLLSAANTVYTKSLQASFIKKSGATYAVGILVVTGAATPSILGATGGGNLTSEFGQSPRICGTLNSLSDLPATAAAGLIFDASAVPYIVITA